MRLLSISGDNRIARGIQGPHWYMLESFAKHWQEIHVLVPFHKDAQNTTLFGNVQVHVCPHPKWRQPFWIGKHGKKLHHKYNFDLIACHEHPYFYNGLGSLSLQRKIKIPLISEYFHIEGHPIASNFDERLRKFLTILYLRIFKGRPQAFRVMNLSQVPDFLKAQGVPESKILHCEALYIDHQVFKPLPEIEKKYDLIYCARLVSNKGLNETLAGFKLLKQEKADATLCIVGQGPLENKVKNFIKQHRLEQAITHIPWVESNQDLAKLYNQSRILCCLSKSEGGPRVTVEAMACGTPVVSSRVGVMPELLAEGQGGLLVDWQASSMKDACLKLLEDHQFWHVMSQQAAASAQQFQKEELIKKLSDCYQDVANQNSEN